MARLAAVFVFLSIAVLCTAEPTSPAQTDAAKRRATSIANQLYATIRNIAFPAGSIKRTEIENRFLTLMPGKVLNYFDYFPGKDYTKFVEVYIISNVNRFINLMLARSNSPTTNRTLASLLEN